MTYPGSGSCSREVSEPGFRFYILKRGWLTSPGFYSLLSLFLTGVLFSPLLFAGLQFLLLYTAGVDHIFKMCSSQSQSSIWS